MSNEFFVEGRWFPNSLQAFTFAQIQADRMLRPVEVWARTQRTWHSTAHPENNVNLRERRP